MSLLVTTKYEAIIRSFQFSEIWHILTSKQMLGFDTQEFLVFSLLISHLLQSFDCAMAQCVWVVFFFQGTC